MTSITLESLFRAGVHFGHRTRFWNPKMAPYIFGARNDLHIIDLRQTQRLMEQALSFVDRLVANRGRVLFVGTKRVAQHVIADQAKRCGMPYVDQRWCGGTLTNFKTIKKSVQRMHKLEQSMLGESFKKMTKKERLNLTREVDKLTGYLGGIRDMHSLPDALLVIDVHQEAIAVREAARLGIPVIGVVDTNTSPDGITYPIPGNDDSMASVSFLVGCMANQILEAKATLAPEKGQKKTVEPVITTVTKASETSDALGAESDGPSEEAQAAKPVAKKVVKRVVAQKKPAETAADEVTDTKEKPAAKKTTKKAGAKMATTQAAEKKAADAKAPAKKVTKSKKAEADAGEKADEAKPKQAGSAAKKTTATKKASTESKPKKDA